MQLIALSDSYDDANPIIRENLMDFSYFKPFSGSNAVSGKTKRASGARRSSSTTYHASGK
jgi:hypothetical protein